MVGSDIQLTLTTGGFRAVFVLARVSDIIDIYTLSLQTNYWYQKASLVSFSNLFNFTPNNRFLKLSNNTHDLVQKVERGHDYHLEAKPFSLPYAAFKRKIQWIVWEITVFPIILKLLQIYLEGHGLHRLASVYLKGIHEAFCEIWQSFRKPFHIRIFVNYILSDAIWRVFSINLFITDYFHVCHPTSSVNDSMIMFPS